MRALLLANTLVLTYRSDEANAHALSGDVNGDGTVDMVHISLIIVAFLSSFGEPSWNSADFNEDSSIDMADIGIAVDHSMERSAQ